MGQAFLQGRTGGKVQTATGSFTPQANTYSWTLPLSEIGFTPDFFLLFATETTIGSSAEIMCVIRHPQIQGTYFVNARTMSWNRYLVDAPSYFRIDGQGVVLNSNAQFGMLKAGVLYRWVAAKM